MGRIEWGSEPEFFGPRHAHREARIVRALLGTGSGPGLHLECAAGVGSLAITIARRGSTVVAADLSLRSLAEVKARAAAAGLEATVLPVVADITRLPFRDGSFDSTSSAETLEHVADDRAAMRELARCLAPGGCLVGTVPAAAGDWADWDRWAGHLRRYTARDLRSQLGASGLEADATAWGWPLVRLYDRLFLVPVNRRRLAAADAASQDGALRAVAGAGRRRWLVRLVAALFSIDRLFDGCPWGVGVLFVARKGASPPAELVAPPDA